MGMYDDDIAHRSSNVVEVLAKKIKNELDLNPDEEEIVKDIIKKELKVFNLS